MSDLSIRPALITKVIPDSICAEMGFEPGDSIVAVNGQKPRDLIDYQFLCADEFLELEVLDTKGKTHKLEIEKDYDEDLGVEFETALFDGLIQCNNRCPFCFIDQQPPGKRETLYLKDDDYRLSFLYGSYLTLTNLTQKEWERIEQMRLSPLYVSVHATEPEVRIRLLKNLRAGKILEQIKWFQERRLQIHAQVVVCPGINDGEHLERTLLDLAKFHTGNIPAVASVAVVPVGLTRFRPAEDELIAVTAEKAREVIEQVQKIQVLLSKGKGGQKAKKQNSKSRCIWLADEWFLIAGLDLPSAADYEDYPQIGNGVGSIRQFIQQFETAFEKLQPMQVEPERKLVWVVGNAVEKAFEPIVQQLNQIPGLSVNMAALCSHYWGQTITVTGLLTGQDLLEALQGRDLGDGILLPSVMLKQGEPRFLDDMTLEQLASSLKTRILPVSGVEELISAAIGLATAEVEL
ncbi:TIGR03279 family radical SAM protein [Microcoleus vaginatus PCC 9802]|uniref:TIGR03279 family radical SAM protein n=1 Tax=Microcoleus vaginatus TaxID=119532 RepID=UPI00020D1094|nr:FeS-containing oxidoreductase [Microcoleus vaginatus FGP-2]UNU19681.1 TIGR03279 family radical SAM protein [Microcoleus vaginatus PCC 9802]